MFFFTAEPVQCAEDEPGSTTDANNEPIKGKDSKSTIPDEIYDKYLDALKQTVAKLWHANSKNEINIYLPC